MRSDVPSPEPDAVAMPDWLRHADRDAPFITPDTSMRAVIELFERNLELRLLPVVDAGQRPAGAIFERDVRRLLLNPYGHALMRNPAYGERIDALIRPCPVAEVTLSIAEMLSHYRSAGGTEGMALTRGGRLCAVIANRQLVQMAADLAVERARIRIEQAERIERSAASFEQAVAGLAVGMADLAEQLDSHAAATVDRAGLVGDRATAVAAAADQTGTAMNRIADNSGMLAGALDRIASQTDRAEQSAGAAARLAQAGREQAQALQQSASSIDAVVVLIGEIAAQVNLLALNAAIEAARAGDAGRGFTVVANEVKGLSAQTAVAAASVTRHIRTITGGIETLAGGHSEMASAVGAIASLSAEIRSAVALQRATTRNIADHAHEVVTAADSIRSDMADLSGSAGHASCGARAIRALATQLNQRAGMLSEQTTCFLADIRTA